MSDYQNAREIEENQRSPKNRFLGLFCHASDVDQSWGMNWPFSCGVILFSIVIGLMTIFDIFALVTLMSKVHSWFFFWSFIRFLSDLIALIAIVFANMSYIQTNFTRATIAYYALIISLICNTFFCGYCIFSIISSDFWKLTTYRIIIWLLNEFILFIFCWILFCNMVDIGRKNRQNAASNPF